MAPPAPDESPTDRLPEEGNGGKGLQSLSFAGLAATQFFTALNDNTYRWLVVSIGYALLGPGKEGLVLSIGLACFVAPYILLVAPAAYLADRYSKRTVMALCMLAQALILVLGMISILITNPVLIFSTLALMGAQGALLGPAKSGTIPETVRPEAISRANGVMGMLMVSAAVIGSVAGNGLYGLTQPLGLHRWWISAAVLIGTALLGTLSSLLILRRPPADPTREFPRRLFARTLTDLGILRSHPRLLAASSASAFFWFLAALAQVNVYLLGTSTLHLSQAYIGPLLAILALGAALGSVVAGIWSGGKVEPGLVPLGAAGLALGGIMMITVTAPRGGLFSAYDWSSLYLFVLGFSSGLYDVPLQSFLQHRSPEKHLGSVLAANNLLAFSAMLLSSAFFWFCRSVLGISAAAIFLIAGLVTVPVFAVILAGVGVRRTASVLARPLLALVSSIRGKG